jgi:hypothetical protein
VFFRSFSFCIRSDAPRFVADTQGENVHSMNKELSVMDTVFQINTTTKADT